MSAVKLRDFFDTQSSLYLSSQRKSQIFQGVKSQTLDSKSISHTNQLISSVRSRRYFKTATSAVTAFVVMYLLYIPFSGPTLDTNPTAIVSRMSGPIVQAGYVGKLLDIQGDIQIMRQGAATNTNDLHDGDIVYLYNTSKADFILKDGSQGTIEGPAQMTIIEQGSGGLMLSVDHARYMQIDKTQSESSDTTTDSSTSQAVESDLIIETSTSRITTHKNTPVHLALVTTQDRQFIQNNGAQVTIESRGESIGEIKQLASTHIAEVTDAVKVYNQVALVYEELKSQSSRTNYPIDDSQVLTSDIRSLLTLELPSQPTRINQTMIALAPSSSINQGVDSGNQISDQENNARAMVGLISFDVDQSLSDHTDIDRLIEISGNDLRASSATLLAVSPTETELPDSGRDGINQEDVSTVVGLLDSDQSSSDTTTRIAKTSITDSGDNSVATALLKPLNTHQIGLLTKISKGCLTHTQFRALQQSFEIKNSLTISQTITQIIKEYYLTTSLQTTLNSLSICNDEKTSTDQ